MNTAKNILNFEKGCILLGSGDHPVKVPKQLQNPVFTDGDLRWVSKKYESLITTVTTGTLIVPRGVEFLQNPNVSYLISDKPRLLFQTILSRWFTPVRNPSIAASASVHPSSKIGQNPQLDNNVSIARNCTIGDQVTIGANTVILSDVVIGNNVTIGANCTIGGVGFGYEKDLDGKYQFIPHLGNVVIHDNVDIGNNTCIDRAVLDSTILHQNVKVDNLVHIAHGVVVQENSLVIAHAMVAGSVNIGKNVWVAPLSAIKNGLTIADSTVIGMGAVVLKSTEPGQIIVGNPGKPLVRK